MGHDGMARASSPAHTPLDGDTIFVLATGEHYADVTAAAIVRGVTRARSLGDYPSVDDFRKLR